MSELPPSGQVPMFPPTPVARDPQQAFLYELIPGIFALYGVGYLYSGYRDEGIKRLIIGIVAAIVIWTVLGITLIGLCAFPVVFLVQAGVAYWSANGLKQQLQMLPPGGPSM